MKAKADIFQYLSAFMVLLSFECFSEQNNQQIRFDISPQTCVIPEHSMRCDLNINFIWYSETSANICLYQQANSEALACSYGKNNRYEITLKLSLTDSTIFTLKDDSSQNPLIKKDFTLMKMSSNQLRRRRKPAWSFL